jgi:hypothetical protein
MTSTLAQALRPFPQFTNIKILWDPKGNSWYDALQAKLTQRFKHGLTAQASFTWQKELTTAEGTNVNDAYNLPVQKAISPSSLPFVFVTAFSYTIPKAPIQNKVVSWVTRDWNLGGSLRYQSGALIETPFATNNLGALLPRQAANETFSNPTGQPFFTKDPNCHCFDPSKTFILNPAAWSQPATGQWGGGAPYYNNYRWQRQPAENLSLGRTFRIKERASFAIRAEFFNIFNRNFLSAPTATPSSLTQVTSPTTGLATSGFGWINTTVTNIQTGGAIPTTRNGQIVARFTW